jgi:hypothetical protein
MNATLRKLLLPVVFLAVALPAGIGVVMAMGDHEQTPEGSAFTTAAPGSPVRFARHAEPRWERVDVFEGSGPATKSFEVAAGAVQWKADWSCRAGALRMTIGGVSQDDKAVATSSCPDVGAESSTGNGRGTLRVAASGPWRVVISQQVDTALNEPPLAGMTRQALLGRGRFHSIQNHGEGTVALYRLAGGRLALRFEHFYTSASPGLRIWLSTARNVTSTLQARQAHHTDAGALRSTLGDYNQMLPRDVSADELRTIVIWCPTVLIAFAAAPLGGQS